VGAWVLGNSIPVRVLLKVLLKALSMALGGSKRV
jgi:hypothetical protein